MKRILLCILLALFSMAGLFALDGLVTWVWFENDPMVEYFRYQVDGEDDDKWTVVDWSVNEVTIMLDVSVVHTLYLQQSYDGENWSESSMTDSDIMTDETNNYEEELLEEEVPVEEETQPEEEPVTEEAAVEQEAEAAAVEDPNKYKPYVFLDYGFGYLNTIPNSDGPKALGLTVSYSHTFMEKDIFHIGAKTNLSLYTTKALFTDVSSTRLLGYFNIQALLSFRVSNSDIYLAFGPDLGFSFVNDSSIKGGLSLEAGIRFHRTEKFALGLALADHYYLVPTSGMINRMDIRFFVNTAF